MRLDSKMDKKTRRAEGVHYTSSDICSKLVKDLFARDYDDLLLKPLDERDALELCLSSFLDPSCGDGVLLLSCYENVQRILNRYNEELGLSLVPCLSRFKGMDINEEAILSTRKSLEDLHFKSTGLQEKAENIIAQDALDIEWPSVSYVIGNPPYVGGIKLTQILGSERDEYCRKHSVSRSTDLCVVFTRKAYQAAIRRCGLILTYKITDGNNKKESLDWIEERGGIIYSAHKNVLWDGDADVYVHIITWSKSAEEACSLTEDGVTTTGPFINTRLSFEVDVKKVKKLKGANKTAPKTAGIPGSALCIFTEEEYLKENNHEILMPHWTADIALENRIPTFIIDPEIVRNIEDLDNYPYVKDRVFNQILPAIENGQIKCLNVKKPWKIHANSNRFNKKPDDRILAIVRYQKRNIIFFLSPKVCANFGFVVSPLNDDYSFGILSSVFHSLWIKFMGSVFYNSFQYTAPTVYHTFVWPQNPSEEVVNKIGEVSVKIREVRSKTKPREAYRLMDDGMNDELKSLHETLDSLVAKAYGTDLSDPVNFMVGLNAKYANSDNLVFGCPSHIKPPMSGDRLEYVRS